MSNKEPLEIYNEYYDQKYYLYSKVVNFKYNVKPKIYYFSKLKTKDALTEVPDGYEIVVGPNSKMFFLRKKRPKDYKPHVKVIKTK